MSRMSSQGHLKVFFLVFLGLMSIDTKISILNANKVNMLTLFALKIDILYFYITYISYIFTNRQ